MSARMTNHCDTLGHIVHPVRGIRPGLDNHGGTIGEVERADLGLHLLVRHAGSLHRLHVVGINVGVLALLVLLLDDLVLVEVDDELKQLVLAFAALNDNLDASMPGRRQSQRLMTVLLLEELGHQPLGRLQQGDDPEVGVLLAKVRAHHPRSL